MRYLVSAILAILVIVAAFQFAKPLPSTNFDESFLPKASSVRYVAAGHDASVAGLFWIKGLTELGESFLTGREYAYLGHVANLCTELDSLFYTPYYFVGGIVSVNATDTTDFTVLRRAVRTYPENWRLAVYCALRLANGPYPKKSEAADIMRPYFDSPDTTIPPYVRTMYRSFELDTMQTEIALATALEDAMQPRYKSFLEGFCTKIYRIIGYRSSLATGDGGSTELHEQVKQIVYDMVDGKIHPNDAFVRLLAMKKTSDAVKDSVAADSLAKAAATPADTTAAVPVDSSTATAR